MHYIILIMMVAFAIAAIQTEQLINAVIYSGVFSLLCSFAYLLYGAPDVAIAEGVIGCTLATIIYLVALTKYKYFRIYYIHSNYSKEERDKLLNNVTRFTDYMSLQQDIVSTNRELNVILEEGNYDIIIVQNPTNFDIYGDESNYHYDNLVDFLGLASGQALNFKYIIPTKEVVE